MIETTELNLNEPPNQAAAEELNDQALGYFLNDASVDSLFGELDFQTNDARIATHYSINQIKTDSVQIRLARVLASATPLAEAVSPLLRALAEIPEKVENHEQMEFLKNILKNEISTFNVVCDEANIPWKKMAIIRYSICTALDEAIHIKSWAQEFGWSQNNLLNHFEGDNDGGNKFFLLIGRLSMTPHEYIDVLEIMLRILGLGFEGRYSIIENGERHLNKIRQRLLTLVQSKQESVPVPLSSHAILPVTRQAREWEVPPVRLSALLSFLVVMGSFISYKYLLVVPGSRYHDQIIALAKSPPIAKPIPVQQAKLRLSSLLKNEIDQNLLTVKEDSGHSVVTIHGDSMFKVGGISVLDARLPLLKRIAEEIHRVKGKVRVIGYTDSMPINKPSIPNNKVLSEKRAQSVALLIQQGGTPAKDIYVEGRGDDNPLASNKTTAGRSQNRRVDIFVDY
jgi:type VI secretion system protein ImpK